MAADKHNLIVEIRDGTLQARCSCGVWQTNVMPLGLREIRKVFTPVQTDHRRHVKETAKDHHQENGRST